MKSMPCLLSSLLVLGVVAARADGPRARAIAPFVDADVVAIGRLDLVKLDIDKLAHQLVTDQEQAGEISQALSPWIAALRNAGAREVYLLGVLPEMLGPKHSPPPVIVPLAEGADAKAISELLRGGGTVKGPFAWPTCATVHNAVLAGGDETLKRVQRNYATKRPEIDSAWTALGDAGVELLLVPSPDTRRVVEEILPNLPKELDGGPVTTITRGLSWAALGLSQDPEPRFRAIFQGKDAAAARSFNDLGKTVLQLVRQLPPKAVGGLDFSKLVDDLKSETTDDRITVTIDAQQAGKWASALLAPIRSREARTRCANNLKQIGLAMHNYLDVHKTFPPAYTVGKNGKPLLSWRVLILPYLDQDALYREFRLDEPWDSPHNKALIGRIPAVYRCPAMASNKANAGKTTYLAPRGKSTIFPGPEGVKIQKITDGTVSTVMVVEAADEKAVIWTRPDDWEVEPALELKGIFGHHPGGSNFGFADGSVRFIRETVDPKVMEKLVTKDGGEVIGQDEF